jgi:tight adherence protein C
VVTARLGAIAGGAPVTLAGLALGAGWAAVVVVVISDRARRRSRRLPGPSDPAGSGVRLPADPRSSDPRSSDPRSSDPRPGTPRQGTPRHGTPAGARVRASPAGALGARIRRLVDPGNQAADHDRASADRRIGWAALASAGPLVVAPALAAAPILWAVAAPVLAERRERTRREVQVVDQLPDVVDLLALTAAAGLPVAAALGAIGDRPGGPVGVALARAAAHVHHGGTTAEALAFVARLGPAARPLVDALAEHDRYGTPLVPALARVGIEARARRRRRAEEAARRLPVTLLFPLVLTTFPAFVLLTIVPLLAGSLGSLSLTSR